MDPNAALRAWREAVADDAIKHAKAQAGALVGWLRTGGFHPHWTPSEMKAFAVWCDRHRIETEGAIIRGQW